MTKEEIFKVLNDWNFWQKEIETGIKRTFYLKKLEKLLKNEEVVVITGARRSGKSFIMRQLAYCLVEKGIQKNQILIVNFEDPRFSNLNASLLQKIYDVYLEFLQPKGKIYLFFDEIQEVDEWEKWVLACHELKKAQVILSGSNAKLLSKELSTLLTGRHLDLTVFPLSFNEFLEFNDLFLKEKASLLVNEIKINGFLRNYLSDGGFPETVLKENKKEILLTYFNDLVEKDLVKRYKIRKTEKIKALLKFYFSNVSSPITFNSLEKSLGLSADTVEKFSHYFENIYLLFLVKRFSFKIKEQEKSPKKIYGLDAGLINAIGFKFSQNIGRLAENIVFLELLRRKIENPDLEIYYWKDEQHREVDFVVKEKGLIKQLIQVCWNLSEIKTKEREIKSLLKGIKETKQETGLIITSDFEAEEKIDDKKIIFIPLWKWLLKI